MLQHIRARSFVALLALAVGVPLAVATAHEDDPKILDRKPPYLGAGYRSGTWGAGGGSFVGGTSFASDNVTLLSWMPLGDFGSPANGSDCWGYRSPSGREYAILGSYTGTHFVDITNPGAPTIVGFISGPNSLWRDIKTYGTHAYAVTEAGSGIQVINLSNIDSGTVTLTGTVTTGGTTSSHNVAIDEDSGYLYRCGGGDNGIRFYNLANPSAPVYEGEWSDRYVHDAQVKTFSSGPYANRQIAFNCGGFNGGFTSTGLSIVDVTDKSNPIHRGQISWPGSEYSHQCWLSEDGQTVYVNDELDEDGSLPTTTYIIDVSDIDNPVYQGSFTNGNAAIGHNLYVKGDLIYEANYTSGLRVFDASGGTPTETAWFDTSPGGDAPSFNGLWSTYPYFESGVVIGSDMERGLFVFWVGAPLLSFAFTAGQPDIIDPAGETIPLTISELTPGSYVSGTAKLHFDDGSGPTTVDLVDLGGGSFNAVFPGLPCGNSVSYYFSAESTSGVTWVDPPNGETYEAVTGLSQTTVLAEDFESAGGWAVGASGDDASTGVWVRLNPVGTSAQPEDDHTPSGGIRCYFTGQGSLGGSIGASDVDDGRTTLTSSVLDLTGTPDPQIKYWRWYSNDQGPNPETDVFVVDISDDGGSSWTNVETVGPAGDDVHGGWKLHQFRVSDFVTPTSNVLLRFVASDEGGGSIVEAAIDDFEVINLECPDCNGNGIPDGIDISSGSSFDLDLEGTPDECQPLSQDKAVLSAILGGTLAFTLNGEAAHASELYLLLGSLSGTDPGFDAGAVHISLNQDFYFTFSLVHANDPPFLNTFGILDGTGMGSAQLQIPPGLTSLIGLTAHHAWVALAPGSFGVTLGSNALPVQFSL